MDGIIVKAVKEAIRWESDHWKLYLPKKEQDAAYRVDVLINPELDDWLRTRHCVFAAPEDRRIWQLAD